MKIRSIIIIGLLSGILFFVTDVVHAGVPDADVLSAIEAGDTIPNASLPMGALYYSAANPNGPPMPGSMGYDAWQIDSNTFLLDDLDTSGFSGRRMGMMDDSGPPGFGDGGDGGGDYPSYTNTFSFPTNGLWLQITNVSNGLATVNLMNATDSVYAVWSRTNLLGGWNVETEVWPTNSTLMPSTVSTANRGSLFLRAEDWTGVDSDGDGIPDWWIWMYFGNLSETATNLDANGNTLLSDYTNGIAPMVFGYTEIETTNNYFNSTLAPAQLNVSGSPYYIAISVDDTNYETDASWQAYSSSNVTVNLGSTEGWHQIWIGLRGHGDAPDAAVWQWKRLKLDYTPPLLVVTSPTNGTVMQPMIELQGYSPEALSGISYDISNAVAVLTNQQVLILDQFYDTNTWEFTTNTFQGFDIPLTNGLNTITLHATDLTGNETTLTTNFTLDYSAKTNPPVVQLLWPQDGMKVCGTNFTLRGRVDDFTAAVSASITDTNGDTNTFNGVVERNGNFWLENLPLNSGTNYLSLTVGDVVGNTTVTNIALVQSSLTLTMNPVSDSSQLWQPTVNVGGSISDAAATVSVNGVQGTNNGDGTWSASNVPVSAGGVASFDMRATSGGNESDAGANVDKPVRLYVASDTVDYDYYSDVKTVAVDYYDGSPDFSQEGQEWLQQNHAWGDGAGGGGFSLVKYLYDDVGPGIDPWTGLWSDASQMTWLTNDSSSVETVQNWDGTVVTNTTDPIGPPLVGNEHCVVNDPQNPPAQVYTPDGQPPSASLSERVAGDEVTQTSHDTYTRTAQTKWHLQTGGKALPQRQSLWHFSGWATEILDKRARPPFTGARTRNIANTQVTITSVGALQADGTCWTTLPDGQDLDVTPVAGKDFYNFNVEAGKYHPYIMANGANLDTDTPTNCVGQLVTFALNWSPSAPAISNMVGSWNLPGKYVNEQWQNFTYDEFGGISDYGSVNYRINSSLLHDTPQTSCWFVNKPGGAVSVGMNLQFPNGQYASVAANGNISIYRPSVSDFVSNSGIDVVLDTNSAPSIYLGNGEPNGGGGGMGWDLYVDLSTAYNGALYYSQLINRNFQWNRSVWYGHVPESSTTDGSFWADNGTRYTAASAYDDTSIFHSTRHIPMFFGDGPSLTDTLYSYADLSDQFQTYVEFQPSGGIPVTLGVVTWSWHGRTDNTNGVWQLSTSTITGPSLDSNNDSFPEWLYILYNTGGN